MQWMLNPKEKNKQAKNMIMIIHNTVITVGENKVEQGEAAVQLYLRTRICLRAEMRDGRRSSPQDS